MVPVPQMMVLGSLLEFGKGLLDRFIPDASERARAEAELMRVMAEGEYQKVIAQLEINAREAAHPSIFVSGGRPFFMWIGGTGFAYATIIQPLLAWLALVKGWPAPPSINNDLLWVVITGLLGISGYRTIEKSKGVASK